MSIKKQHWGNLAGIYANYEYVGQAGEHYGHHWSIHTEPFENEKGWRSFRLCVSGGITGRANYRIGWNAKQNRFAGSHDLTALQDKRPALFSAFQKVLMEQGYIQNTTVKKAP